MASRFFFSVFGRDFCYFLMHIHARALSTMHGHAIVLVNASLIINYQQDLIHDFGDTYTCINVLQDHHISNSLYHLLYKIKATQLTKKRGYAYVTKSGNKIGLSISQNLNDKNRRIWKILK